MKGYECHPNDLVNYDGARHKVLSIHGDSLTMLNLATQREVTISKYHFVVMVERPRKTHPGGINWRVYQVSVADETKRRVLKKGMTFLDAEAFVKGLKIRDDVKYIIRDKTFKKA